MRKILQVFRKAALYSVPFEFSGQKIKKSGVKCLSVVDVACTKYHTYQAPLPLRDCVYKSRNSEPSLMYSILKLCD